MRITTLLSVAAVMLTMSAAKAQPPAAEDVRGQHVFESRCKTCHDPAIERAPSRRELGLRTRPDIVTALTGGVMKPMAAGLSKGEIDAVAAYLTPADTAAAPTPGQAGAPVQRRRGGLMAARGVDAMCATNPPISASAGDWPLLGKDGASTRYQPRSGIAAADVPRLKVKWAFTTLGGGAPSVVGDWLFLTNRGGKFYALDAKTGCVHWAVEGAGSRTTPLVIRSAISPSGWAAFIGLSTRTVRAYDAQTGKEIWRSEPLDPNPVAGITGSFAISGDRLFVPITSGEEGAAIQATYPCCSFRGSLAALDVKSGKVSWQTPMIAEPMRPLGKTSAGVAKQGPAGAALWSAPTVDVKRGLVYVATGDSYTEAATKGTDAITALEMNTGKVRWSNQVTAGDNYVMACEKQYFGPNCPKDYGPDADFGASPILLTLPGGKDMLLAGQKSGAVYGLDPDSGKLKWSVKVGGGSALGGVEWGMASDPKRLFVSISDVVQLFDEAAAARGDPMVRGGLPPATPGLYALNPATGAYAWKAPAPKAPCGYAGDRSQDYAKGECMRAMSAPPTAIPGAVFQGALDGWLRAYDPATGKVKWAFSATAQSYATTNGVPSQPGGGFDGVGGGPVIAGGMLYVVSGFNGAARTGGNGNNVLLAFSVDGR